MKREGARLRGLAGGREMLKRISEKILDEFYTRDRDPA